MGIVFFIGLGFAVGLLWHIAPKSRVMHPFADASLGALGSVVGAFVAAIFEPEQRILLVWPGSVVLAVATALGVLWTARAVARVPVDA